MYSIGLCIDERYVSPALTLLLSAASALPARDRQSVGVRIITDRLTRRDAAAIQAFCDHLGFGSFDLRWRRPAKILPLVDRVYITQATYLRFDFTPDFVGNPFLVYLDADMLVLGDISSPLNVIQPGTVGAVRDQFNTAIGECPALPGFVADFPSHRGKPYVNAGALWMEVALMPKIRLGIHLVALHAAKYIKHNDQDALNLCLLKGPQLHQFPWHITDSNYRVS